MYDCRTMDRWNARLLVAAGHAAAAGCLALLLSSPLDAQQSPRDSTAARDTLESVVIRALRAGGATPTSQTTLDRRTIERTYAGQDAPLALLGATGITAASDAGAFSGYSSIRLRGVDQTRLAISVDGVPLNDPEDQVLYFSNVPDFMNSMHSVQVQRGVGSSAFGTASFAGSLDFQSLPLMTTERFAEGQLTGGSWGTQRVSVEGATGLVNGFAAYGRVSTQETVGYREHSGNEALSGFVSAGWFGSRDALKLTGFAGRSKMQLAYYAPSEAELEANPRTNVMGRDERDDFRQEMLSLQYTRVLRPGVTVTTTGYRNSAGGWYDVDVGDPTLWRFNLDHVWYGLLSTLNYDREGLSVSAGAHLSRYARDHFLNIKPDTRTRIYDNTGHKAEQSAFVKATVTRGAFDWTGDLQLRRAAFRYEATPGNSFDTPRVDWLFMNPKVGVTWRAQPALSLFASLGQASREPTRSDMFAGADDMDDAAAADLLPLSQVKPERLTDVEVGARWRRGTLQASVNGFAMWFQDEIAAIGAIAVTGSQLRKNVDRSTRLGVEGELAWQVHRRLLVTGNAMLMRARIAEYTDEASATTYTDVAPVLSPAVIANAQLAWQAASALELTLSGRHVGESQLANDGNAALVTPAFTLADLGLAYTVGRSALRVQVQNLFDATAYASGYTDGSVRYFFPVAARTVLATVTVGF
ncbi:MAG: TonB-dependent receptor [Gemmatimonadaceae bacterium]|nr:TonB-dependent receptor [Gemmatimonadaceae bacterium]